MANCGISSGMSVTCDALRRVSGLFKYVWAYNLTDLRVPLDATADSYISGIEFTSYRGLYKLESAKNSHQLTSEIARSDGGNVAFNQTAVLRLYNSTPEDDAIIESLTVADVGIIAQTKNNEFWMFGIGNGLTATAGTITTGRNTGEDTTFNLTLTGSETKMFKRFFKTDINTTLAYLNALTL
jgi:hypothetical protein